MKRLCMLTAAALLLTAFSAPAAQARSYQYNEWGEAVPAPDGYTCTRNIRGDQVAAGENWELSDLFADEDGNLAALDANGGRIHIFDGTLQYRQSITLTEDGEDYFASGVSGLFVSGSGEQKTFYIADPTGGQVLLADAQGRITRKIGRPQTDLIGEDAIFDPTKVQLDKSGNLYILAPGLYMGACVLAAKDDYRFKTFIASNPIEKSFSVVMDHLWKQILSEEQVARMKTYVPVAFANFTLDEEGYLYTVTNKNTDAQTHNEIKKFNTTDSNILPDQRYGDLELGYVDYKLVNTAFADIAVSKAGNMVAIDGNMCRVHVFNQRGDRLFVFGERGKTTQALDTPVAVEAIGDNIYILDRNKASISLYEPTPYGQALLEADRLHGRGEYLEAAPYWAQVLQDNAGCLLALDGMGKAALEQKQYDRALEYFRLAGAREDYSQAFGLYRGVRVKAFFPVLFILLIAGFVGLLVVERRVKRKRNYRMDPAQKTFCGKIRYALFHPCEGGFVLARRTDARACMLFSLCVAAVWFVASVTDWQYAGFLFNTNDLENFEVFIHLLKTFGVFVLWILSSWFVSNLTDSSARLTDLVAATSVALLPYVASVFLHTLLSNLLTQQEAAFLQTAQVILLLWAVVILLGGMKEIHEMTVRKTILLMLFTLLGMAFIVFLLLLIVSLFQNVLNFVSQIWQELVKMA